MRGSQSIRTRQRTLAGVALVRAVRRGPIGAPPDAGAGGGTGTQMPTRVAATIYMWLADRLRVAA
jgi:hypothetical protein